MAGYRAIRANGGESPRGPVAVWARKARTASNELDFVLPARRARRSRLNHAAVNRCSAKSGLNEYLRNMTTVRCGCAKHDIACLNGKTSRMYIQSPAVNTSYPVTPTPDDSPVPDAPVPPPWEISSARNQLAARADALARIAPITADLWIAGLKKAQARIELESGLRAAVACSDFLFRRQPGTDRESIGRTQ